MDLKAAYCFYNPINHFDTSGNLFFRFSKDKAVKIFFGIVRILVWPSFTLLHTALASNTDFCTALSLHLFQTVAAGTDEQAEEIDLRKFFDGNVNFIRGTLRALLLVILDGRAKVRIVLHSSVDKPDALVF